MNALPVTPKKRRYRTPVIPTARISSAVPATTWFTARLTTRTARIALIATPPAMPAPIPRIIDPLKYAAARAKKAPASIAPSIPILMIPLCSTSNSPSAPSRTGVAMLIVELRNASSIGWPLRGTRGDRHRATQPAAESREQGRIEREQDHYHEGLDDLDEFVGNALCALHRLRSVVERAEHQRRGYDSERMEPRDECHRDSFESPPGRHLFVQPMGDRGDLDRARQPRHRPRKREHGHAEPRNWDAEEGCRAPVPAHRAHLETDRGLEQQHPASNCRRHRENNSEVQPAWRHEHVHVRALGDRGTCRIGARWFDQGAVND